jgi:hypothetical protein
MQHNKERTLEEKSTGRLNEVFRTGLSNAAPAIYPPGDLIYSAGFDVNQNFKKKYIYISE